MTCPELVQSLDMIPFHISVLLSQLSYKIFEKMSCSLSCSTEHSDFYIVDVL